MSTNRADASRPAKKAEEAEPEKVGVGAKPSEETGDGEEPAEDGEPPAIDGPRPSEAE